MQHAHLNWPPIGIAGRVRFSVSGNILLLSFSPPPRITPHTLPGGQMPRDAVGASGCGFEDVVSVSWVSVAVQCVLHMKPDNNNNNVPLSFQQECWHLRL